MGASSDTTISSVGSPVRRQTAVTIQPSRTPTAIPPTPTTTNDRLALSAEKDPNTTAATATRYRIRADASLTRLSPSRIVMTRRGTPRRRSTDVAATASGGATIAPNANAGAHWSSSTSRPATSPTASVVNSTSPIASWPMARTFALKSRIGVVYADPNRIGGRNKRKTSSGGSSMVGASGNWVSTSPSPSPPRTSRIG